MKLSISKISMVLALTGINVISAAFSLSAMDATKAVGSPLSYDLVPDQATLTEQQNRITNLVALGTLNPATITSFNPHGATVDADAIQLGRPTPGPIPTPGPFPPVPRRPLIPSGPKPFTTLSNAVDFILSQGAGTNLGLPATYAVPRSLRGIVINNSDSNRIIREGIGLYDSSLAIMALIESGDMADSKKMIDAYLNPVYGNLALRAVPDSPTAAFQPFGTDPVTGRESFYLFDFTRVNGQYTYTTQPDGTQTPDWNYFAPHTGPNAWLVLAIAQYVQAAKSTVPAATLQPYIDFISDIGNGMLLLQNPPAPLVAAHGDSQGCIRYSPTNTYDAFHDPFEQCNTENNVSAYAALGALYTLTGDPRYKQGQDGIMNWLQNATIYPDPAKPDFSQKGIMDPATGMFYWDVYYNPTNQHWQARTDLNGNPAVSTDGGGTWAISSLGPELIDSTFGAGAAARMWESTRQLMGRTASSTNGTITSMTDSGSQGRLDGLDFSNFYPENESLISPEWTAGGINAIKQLQSYYGNGKGKGQVPSTTLNQMTTDISSMQAFIAQHSTSYAVGPGLYGSRQGQTGYDWICPPADVAAMAAIYNLLSVDPLAWARQ